MPKPLIIVESPAKARTLERLLGRRCQVKASMGHIRDLPRSQFGVDVEHGFTPKYITIRGKGDIVKQLRDSAKKAGKVYLATDPDREGEAISWHLADILNLPANAVRIEFHEITKEAVEGALKHPRPINMNLVDAQQARRVLDRVVGYKLSPLLWRKVRPGLSAGRVQSVALKLIVDRERQIQAFVPEEYWSLTARLARCSDEVVFAAKYWGEAGRKVELKAAADVDRVQAAVARAAFSVVSVKSKERRRLAEPAFITSTMQQEAFRKLGFPVRRTMAIAQQLYEGLEVGGGGAVGLITYMRTDSTRIAAPAREEVRKYIKGRFGAKFVPARPREAVKAKGAQEAHEAIRPTAVSREPETLKPYLSSEQYRLYRLIWERFVASEMAAALFDVVTAEIAAGRHLFRASGSTLRFAGFTALYTVGEDEPDTDKDEGNLPELVPGEPVRLAELVPKQHFTQAPPRYTEATLVRALEEQGIGRPSTYAPTIDTIVTRGYASKSQRRLVPTELGTLVTDLLTEHFADVVDVEFTAELERRLDEVEEGSRGWHDVLGEFYPPFLATLTKAEEAIGPLTVAEEVSDVLCEKCGQNMVVKWGRYGKFLACPGFPECRSTKPLIETVPGRCPRCGGELAARRTKQKRRFYGCVRYPECDYVSWKVPAGECPACGTVMFEQRRRGQNPVLVCAKEECGHRMETEAG